jgi:hypothetical protein
MRGKQNRHRVFGACSIGLCLWLTVFLPGCSTDLSLNPETEAETSADAVSPNPESGRLLPESALKFIDLPVIKGKDGIAGSETYVEEEISAEDGGKIHLNYVVSGKDNIHVNSMLDIDPYAISQDITVSLSLPQDNLLAEVDLIFGPHNTQFATPAEFKLEANHLDLSCVGESDVVGFYYYREDLGLWELLDAEVSVNLENGHINARASIDHFSRYALAISR